MNAVAMAMAGAERIFKLMDETVEQDQGVVTLTRCKIDEQGHIEETQEYTTQWAWRHPRANGEVEYVPFAERYYSMMLRLAMYQTRQSCIILNSMQNRDKRLLLLALQVPEKQRSPI